MSYIVVIGCCMIKAERYSKPTCISGKLAGEFLCCIDQYSV